MKKLNTFSVIIVIFAALSIQADARPFRVNEIPNGTKNSCFNCHFSDEGGARNDFGREIGTNHLDNSGHVIWSAALAALDSDGDGYTNGTELQDPSGAWVRGNPAPGDPSQVFNPGDAASKPATGIWDYYAGYTAFIVSQPYPSPSVNGSSVIVNTADFGHISAYIYGAGGSLVKSFVSDFKPAGDYSYFWDGTDNFGNSVPAGAYIFSIKFNNEVVSQKVIITR